MRPARHALASIALAGAAASAGAVNLVSNGGFESPSLTNATAQCFINSTLGGWASAGPEYSCYITPAHGPVWPLAQEGGQYMYLNNDLRPNVQLSQSVALQQGWSYQLSFYVAGISSLRGGIVVAAIDGQTSLQSTVPDFNTTWAHRSVSFVSSVTGSRTLSFISPTGGSINIDNVSLVVTAVPEPSAALLTLLGLPVVAWLRRRQQAVR